METTSHVIIINSNEKLFVWELSANQIAYEQLLPTYIYI